MESKRPETATRRWKRFALFFGAVAASLLAFAPAALAKEGGGGEASLVLPNLGDVSFHGMSGSTLLALGLIICALGLLFGVVVFYSLRRLPAHRSMLEISELIWQTCKTYLFQQGKFLAILWVFIAVVIGVYFGALSNFSAGKSVSWVATAWLGSVSGSTPTPTRARPLPA
jgi:K(+)-stimulated pyrophosphate-energized sodium pump